MLKRFVICFLPVLALTAVRSSGADLQSLLSKPPFESAPTGPATPAGPSGPIEFRGMMREGQKWSFCVYNVQAKTSTWVGLQESGQSYFVKSYDSAKETIQVEYSQSTYTLPLRVATTPTTNVPVQSLAANPVPPRPGASIGPVPVTTGAPGTGPTVINEANAADPNGVRDMRRMEQLAREAARLRAERARNLNSNPGPVPTPPKQ